VTLVLCLWASGAGAQTDSSIAGVVRDSTGAVLPGVTVEATSPALIEKVRSVVTDETGRYRIIELRPGTYAVTFSLTGFNTARRDGIELTTGFTAAVDAELRVGAVAETITVSGATPIVDIQNVVQQRVMTRDVIDAVPTAKGYANLGVLVPGMVVSGLGRAQDVGGTEGQANQGISIHGGRTFDQLILLDGMTIGTNEGVGGGTVWMNYPDALVEEVNLGVGAHSAEMESGGVRVNIIPKSGGNLFRGTTYASFANKHLQSSNLSDDLRARGLGAANRVDYLSDVNPAFGGPIVRDKLWFYGGYRSWRTVRISTVYPDTDRNDWVYIADRSRPPEPDDQLTWNGSGRVTWQASPRNKLSLMYTRDRRCDCHSFAGSLEPLTTPDAGVEANYPTDIVQATWMSPVTRRWLFEAGMSLSRTALLETPHDGVVAPPAIELSTGLNFRSRVGGAAASLNEGYPLLRGRNNLARFAASYVAGGHSFKVGLALNPGQTSLERKALGEYLVVLLNGVPNRVEYRPMPYSTVEDMNKGAVFVQDQLTLKRLTLNGGLRFDWLSTSYPDVHLPATGLLPARDFPGADVLGWKDISPRLGAAYNLFGNGKTALKLSVNRYLNLESTALTRLLHPAVTSGGRIVRAWVDSNGDFVPNGDPLNPLPNGELVGVTDNVNFGRPIVTLRYDPSWTNGWNTRIYNWETTAGIQHELLPRVSVGGNYFRRQYGNLTVTDNLAVAPTDYDPFCVTAPADARLPSGGGGTICGLYDIRPSQLGKLDRLQTRASTYGDQIEYWQGVDLTVGVRLLNGVLLQGGTSTGRTITDNCDVIGKLDNPSTRFCHVEPPFLTQVKLLGSYVLPGSVQLSGTFQSIPGNTVSANYVARNAQISSSLGRDLAAGPNGTVTVNLLEPGTMLSDRVNQLDVRLARTFTRGAMKIKGMVDFYNVANANPVLGWNNTYGTNGASWLVPTAILQARLVKFGVQLDF
jgi:hypothetical protein